MSKIDVYDVVIVGAGICGLITAYKLAHYKLNILVIDMNIEPGWGVSKGHAAIVHVIQLPFKSLKSKLAREGNRELLKICEYLKVRYRKTSTLLLAMNLLHLLALPLIYLYLKLNLKGEFKSRIIGRRTLRRIEPNVSDKVLAAIEVDGYAVIDSFDLIYGLYEFLKINSVHFVFGEKVVRIDFQEDFLKIYTDGGREFLSRYLVNAGGLYADEVARLLGDYVEFELGKGVMIVFEKQVSDRLLSPLTLRPDPKTKGGAVMFTWDGKGLWGPNLRIVRDKNDLSIEESDVNTIISRFSKLVKADPGIPIKAYSGIRPIPPINDFIITYSKKSRRIVNILGTESPALTSSPAIARVVLEKLKEAGLELIPREDIVERVVFHRFRDKPECGKGRLICICNRVTEEEVREAVRRGSKTLQGVMFRTGVCMGVCQGSRCLSEVIEVISDELRVKPSNITLRGGGSWIVKTS
jgi:glycerol-3-phosphate dehydrogenase